MRYKVSLKNNRTVIEYIETALLQNIIKFYSNISYMVVTKVLEWKKHKFAPLDNSKQDYFKYVSLQLINEDKNSSFISLSFVKADKLDEMTEYILKNFQVNSKPVKQIIVGAS